MTQEEIHLLLKEAIQESNIFNFEKSNILAKKVIDQVQKLVENTTEIDSELHKMEVFAVLRIASNKNLQMKTAESIVLCDEAEKLIELYNLEELNAQLFNIKGNNANNLHQNSEALEYYQKALQSFQKENNPDGFASTLVNIGNVHSNIGQFHEAIEYYLKSIAKYEEIDNTIGLSLVYGSIAIVYRKLSEYNLALEYNYKALSIHVENKNNQSEARILGNIGNIFLQISDFDQALNYYQQALSIDEDLNNKHGIARTIGNIGNLFYFMDQYDSALEYYQKSLILETELGNENNTANLLLNMSAIQFSVKQFHLSNENLYKALRIYEKNEEWNMIAISKFNIGKNYIQLKDFSKGLSYLLESLQLLNSQDDRISKANVLLSLADLYLETDFKERDFIKAKSYIEESLLLSEIVGDKNLLLSVYSTYSKVFELFDKPIEALNYYKKSIEIKNEIVSEEAKSKALEYDHRRKVEEAERDRQVKLARFQEQEKLLHTILPMDIADRILKHETFIADHFETVSVLFMDLVGFTTLSSIAPPKQLVFLLDAIFQKADEVVESFGLEKIKTIGDGYLAVANVTSPLENHPKATALAALQLLETMRNFTVNIPSDLGDTVWTKNMNDIEIRIGIHTGEVVAGIIGKNKFTYDLWGDAVNVASRMESYSEAGRIHISEAFAKSIEKYPEFSLIPRGEINIKGKGTMNTFWLEKGR